MSEVKSAVRVVAIFELLSGHGEGLRLTDISSNLGIPPSSCYELLQTLHCRGYLTKDDLSLTYRLGTKLLQLVGAYMDSFDLIPVADPVMEQMSRVCGEAVSLAILEGTDVVFIHKKTSGGMIRIVNPVGTRLPAHGTALGKVILVELSPDELDALYPHDELDRYTAHTITNKQALKRCLAEVRERGIAYDRQESALGIEAVASAVRDHNHFPIASISIAVLSSHEHDKGHWHRLEEIVKAGARTISAQLGYATASDRRSIADGECLAWQDPGRVLY